MNYRCNIIIRNTGIFWRIQNKIPMEVSNGGWMCDMKRRKLQHFFFFSLFPFQCIFVPIHHWVAQKNNGVVFFHILTAKKLLMESHFFERGNVTEKANCISATILSNVYIYFGKIVLVLYNLFKYVLWNILFLHNEWFNICYSLN